MKRNFIILLLLAYFSVSGQEILFEGQVIFYDTKEILPGTVVEAFKNKRLLQKTESNLEKGSFALLTNKECNRLEFSFVGCYPVIIENIDNLNTNNFELGKIELLSNPLKFSHYIKGAKKEKRNDKKIERTHLNELKQGLKIENNGKGYVMKLRKKKGKYAFYINFQDLKIE